MEAELYNLKGEVAGKVDLPEHIFGLKPSKGLLHEVVTAARANQRSGTASTKTRSEVSGGGRKLWKQKHTGRARMGSIRSPLWRHGGVVFGPKPRSYRQELPREKVLLALGHALSSKRAQGALKILEAFEVEEPKTRRVVEIVRVLKAPDNTLVVGDQFSGPVRRASRNLRSLRLSRAADLNAYEVLRSRCLLLTRTGLEALSSRFKGPSDGAS